MLLCLLQKFELDIRLTIFKSFFHTSAVYHSMLVEIITMQKWLIFTSQEFTVIYANPSLMQ